MRSEMISTEAASGGENLDSKSKQSTSERRPKRKDKKALLKSKSETSELRQSVDSVYVDVDKCVDSEQSFCNKEPFCDANERVEVNVTEPSGNTEIPEEWKSNLDENLNLSGSFDGQVRVEPVPDSELTRFTSDKSDQLIAETQPLAEVEGLFEGYSTLSKNFSQNLDTDNGFNILDPSYDEYQQVAELQTTADEMTSGGDSATVMQEAGPPNGATGTEDTNGVHPQDPHSHHHQQQQHYLNPYFSSSHSNQTGSPTPSGNQANHLSYYGRSMSQYMQDNSTNSSHYLPYSYITGTQQTEAGSPSSSSMAALAAYYNSGTTGIGSDYAANCYNYMAAAAAGSFYGSGYDYGSATSPHLSGSSGHLNSGSTGLHGLASPGNGSSHMGSQTIYHLSSLPPPPSISEPGSNSLDDVLKASSRKSSNRGRSSKRRNSQSPDPENSVDRVFIWDLDETIILFHSLLTGSYAMKNGKDGSTLQQMGQTIEDLIYFVADSTFFYNDLEECDQVVQIDDLSGDDNGQDLTNYNFTTDGFRNANAAANDVYLATGGMRGGVDWMRKLAFRFRKIKENYNLFRHDVGRLLGSPKREQLHGIRQELEVHTDNWLTLSTKCLNIIKSRPGCVNVIVTQTQLVAALAKILVFGLGSIFDAENIYCASKSGKEPCFERIAQRFGRKSTFLVLGDGSDEETAARNMGFPFWRINGLSDLVALNSALDMQYI